MSTCEIEDCGRETVGTLIWARIVRGVKPEYWLTPCARCGFTGKAHQHGFLTPCWRFKPPHGVGGPKV
jgi:hypothetical protein